MKIDSGVEDCDSNVKGDDGGVVGSGVEVDGEGSSNCDGKAVGDMGGVVDGVVVNGDG